MKLENQVCTLEQAKKLKELGIVQDSLFMWWESESWNIERGVYFSSTLHRSTDTINNRTMVQSFSAFTVAELGLMLGNCDFAIKPFAGGTYELRCIYLDFFIFGNSMADCLAKAVITYISDSKLQVSRINYRLQEINNRTSPTIQESEP